MFNVLYSLFIVLYAFYLPGYLISRLYFKKSGFIATFALSLGLSVVLIPITVFGAALLLHVTVQKSMVCITVTVINVIFLTILLCRKKTACSCVNSTK